MTHVFKRCSVCVEKNRCGEMRRRAGTPLRRRAWALGRGADGLGYRQDVFQRNS